MICEKTVRRFCCQDPSFIENYEEAMESDETYDCHHRREIADGKVLSVKELKEQDLYYNRPAEELIFLSHREHLSLHHKGKKPSDEARRKIGDAHKGKKQSEEARRKNAEANKGENNPMYGKHHTEEAKHKMADAKRGKPSGMKGKSSPCKGRHWKLVDGKRVWY